MTPTGNIPQKYVWEFPGNPTNASTSIINPPLGAFVVSTTDGAWYRKTTGYGDNTGYTLTGGNSLITIQHANGTVQAFGADNTDIARGALLATVLSSAVSGDVLDVGPGNYLMRTTANLLVAGVTYQFRGSRLYIDSLSTSSLGSPFSDWLLYGPQPSVSDYTITGPLTLDGAGISGKSGLVIQAGGNRTLRDINSINWPGYGFWLVGGSLYGNIMEACRADNCGIGISVAAEYCRVTDCFASNCTTGIEVPGGNIRLTSCGAQSCTTGLSLTHGSNDGHGVWTAGDLNHNTTNLSVASDFAQGFTFMGAHAYAGDLDINGIGIFWIGGDIASNIISSGTLTGMNVFSGVRWPQAARSTYLTGLSGPQLAHFTFLQNFSQTAPELDIPVPFSGTVSPVNSLTALNGVLTAVS